MTSTLDSPVVQHHETTDAGTTAGSESDGFAALGLSPRLVDALAAAGITHPFPIQRATLPDALAGRDVLGRGRTGSGKTYAFAIPVLERLVADGGSRQPGRPRALVLAPTRELASQIDATMAPLARALGLRTLTVYGGVRANPQIAALRQGVDIVIACPGRLVDHLRSGHVKLDRISVTVLDEADHMADLGFLPDVRRLLDQTPRDGQRLLFSATLDRAVDVLVKRFMRNPVTHSVDSVQSPVAEMAHHVLHIDHAARLPVLVDLASAPGRTLVFTRTKHGARLLAQKLTAAGAPAVELHGNLSQNARAKNLKAFSQGSAPTLVATDIAARGIHVDDIALVVHADPPVEHKAYLHRSGRTARAGNAGTVVTLMTDAQARDVRTLTRKAGVNPTITKVRAGHPLLSEIAPGERTLVTPSPVGAGSTSRDGDRVNARRGNAGRSKAGRGNANRGGRSGGSSAKREDTNRSGRSGEPRRSRGGADRRTASGRAGSGSAAAFSSGTGRRRGR